MSRPLHVPNIRPRTDAVCAPLALQVAETCQLAVRRLEWLQQHPGQPTVAGPYLSVDPAPPAEERDMGQLREALLDETLPLFDRYRAMFALRNAGGQEAALALAEGEEAPGWAAGNSTPREQRCWRTPSPLQWPHLSSWLLGVLRQEGHGPGQLGSSARPCPEQS